MLLEKLQKALELTTIMREHLIMGELEEVQRIAGERDDLLHDCFDSRDAKLEPASQEAGLIKQIMAFNDEMIAIGIKEKAELYRGVERELHASSSIKKYLDNME